MSLESLKLVQAHGWVQKKALVTTIRFINKYLFQYFQLEIKRILREKKLTIIDTRFMYLKIY